MNEGERRNFDEYLIQIGQTVTGAAVTAINDHADRCYAQNLKPINEKLDRLLVVTSEQVGRQHGQDTRQDKQDVRMGVQDQRMDREEAALVKDRAELPEQVARKVWVMWGIGLFLAATSANALVAYIMHVAMTP